MPSWHPDLLAGHEATDLPLPGVRPAPGEPPGTRLRATLVRRLPVGASSAVLHVHGWNDYFFQTHLGERVTALGHDFYALDLRRCGRSLGTGQLPGYVDDLDDYDAELGLALDLVAAEHDSVVLLGHSTGGLVTSLWAARHPSRIRALVLNSPWLQVAGPPLLLRLAGAVVDGLARPAPTAALRLPDVGHYVRSVHATRGGEWDYDLALKTSPSPPVRLGWLRAVMRGQARVADGLDLHLPVLVLLSARSESRVSWHEGLREVDSVIDVDLTAARASRLGEHVTLVRVEGALHDVFLSAATARHRAFDELGRWLAAYAPGDRPAAPRR